MRTDTATAVGADVYSRVLQFYAGQMGALDDGRVDAWADTFTTDAVFSEPNRMAPLRGRDAIRASARARADRLAAELVDFRHWLGMITVTPLDGDELRTRCYALAMRTPKGGALDVFAHVTCHDHLVHEGGALLVKRRDIHHDGAPRDGGDHR